MVAVGTGACPRKDGQNGNARAEGLHAEHIADWDAEYLADSGSAEFSQRRCSYSRCTEADSINTNVGRRVYGPGSYASAGSASHEEHSCPDGIGRSTTGSVPGA
jgi:hypothetical protein